MPSDVSAARGPLAVLEGVRALGFTRLLPGRPPPVPGERAEEILREPGYGDDDIRRLRAAGAV